MGKNKLKKFSQINTFPNVVQPGDLYPVPDHPLQGKWHENFFMNNNPIILEIGCGKGEYTTGLGRSFPGCNFIGIDIKGERLWKGARQALDEGLLNVAFLRIQAERINHYFRENEVAAIWLTFPDPQLQVSRRRKRLTSPDFLEKFRKILQRNAVIHLKTDNRFFFDFTLEVIKEEGHQLLQHTFDLYSDNEIDEPGVKQIQTYYESKYLEQGIPINYLQFRLSDREK